MKGIPFLLYTSSDLSTLPVLTALSRSPGFKDVEQKSIDLSLLFHWFSDISFDFCAIYFKGFPIYAGNFPVYVWVNALAEDFSSNILIELRMSVIFQNGVEANARR